MVGGSFLVFVCLLLFLLRRFRRDAVLPDQVVVPRWERTFQAMAALDGAFWAVPIVLTHGAPLEFRLLTYLVICAVLAVGTTFLAPHPRVFFPFFAAIYGPTLLASAWYFPDRWQAMLPLTVLYGGVVLRHAWGSRRFVVQQVEMERQRLQLAQRYLAAKEEAERALEEKNRFLSTASHDLRQPLHAMGLLVESAQQRNADAGLVPVLEGIQDCARSLTFLFNALLDLSRLESGAYAVVQEDVPLAEVLHDVSTVFGPDARHRGLRLKVYLPRRRPAVVRADAALLRQMVFNLVQNALRYTRVGGVLIGARMRRGVWRIEVWDTGPGVPQEDRHRIYAPLLPERGPLDPGSRGPRAGTVGGGPVGAVDRCGVRFRIPAGTRFVLLAGGGGGEGWAGELRCSAGAGGGSGPAVAAETGLAVGPLPAGRGRSAGGARGGRAAPVLGAACRDGCDGDAGHGACGVRHGA